MDETMNNPEQPASESGTAEPEQQDEPDTAKGRGAPEVSTKVRGTRMSVLWSTLVVAAVVLVLLLIFIVQNLHTVRIYFFGASGQLPAGVALLLAVVGGIVLVAVPGYGRMLQLRRAIRKSGARK